MKRVPPPEHERDERLAEEHAATEGDVGAKARRARVAESQEKILATYADTFRRLAE